MEVLEPYRMTIFIAGLCALLYWVQLSVIDAVAIFSRKIPGYSVEQNHSSFAFRSNRALANTNESAAIFILSCIFSIASLANPQWLSFSVLAYFLGRCGHMLCYYLNLQVFRSISFIVSFFALLSVLCSGFWRWL